MDLNKGLRGETPLDGISGLIPAWVRTMDALDEVVSANIAEVVTRYLASRPSHRLAPFTVVWMLRLHREMLGKVWRWAGKIRRAELNLGIDWHLIMEQLENLARDAACWLDSNARDLIEEATIMHHRAVWIHPFMGGNGRWSRLLAEIWLRRNEYPGIAWPEAGLSEGQSPIRDEYIDALHEADKGDMDPLIALHRRFART